MTTPPFYLLIKNIMKYIIIFNFIVTLSIVGYLLYIYFQIEWEVNKTFWYEKPYSITIWMRTSDYGRSKVLFTIPFRNEKKSIEWDDKQHDKQNP